MRIAFFGGTFDPVHLGHLAVARAAAKKFGLKLIYFAPADIPPHKQKRALAGFAHRYAMLSLATAGQPGFVPSLIDAYTGMPNYSFESLVRLKKTLSRSDRLYFLIGVDAFKDISTWYKPVELLNECDFIVASRPGYSLADAARALPEALQPPASELEKLSQHRSGFIRLPRTTLHLLDRVNVPISSTKVRTLAQGSIGRLRRFVPKAVADYIKKERLYIENS
ncbi:MAG TPA: nicotinate-nucleotide adenylyltransferase [Candidatus Angelobacter sp.]|nr:nicotinate-nucleotide adenylyltransferase [Candidatus Angelobacter sp.]